MLITITGTPGTGKTHIAKKLKNFKYFDLNGFIKKNKLFYKYDKKDMTYDVDVKKIRSLNKRFSKYLDKEKNALLKRHYDKSIDLKTLQDLLKHSSGIIIDSHLSHYLKSDLCILVKSDIKNIKKRLEKRLCAEKKIQDNIQSEIFDICLEEAVREKNNIVILKN